MNKIAFIGAGNMTRAIIIGLVSSGYNAANIIVSNPSPEKRISLSEEFGVLQTSDNSEAVRFADYVVLGVKPYLISDVCQRIAKHSDISSKCFISIAAGSTITQIQQALSDNLTYKIPVIRVMPNTPSQLGLGMSGIFASTEVSSVEKTVAEQLMSAVGKVIWLDTEEKINDIISIAGSAPAYFFLFMEAMEKQAMQLGFSAEESRMLVEQTALGSAHMVIENKIAISTLRENVTSKGGATQAAISQFVDDGLEQTVINAMNAALHRAEEMAKEG